MALQVWPYGAVVSAQTITPPAPLAGRARRRRLVHLFLAVVPTVVAAATWPGSCPQGRHGPVAGPVVVTCCSSADLVGFWTAMVGFFTLLRRTQPMNVPIRCRAGGPPPDHATAILMPIYNEVLTRSWPGCARLRVPGRRRGSRALRLLRPLRHRNPDVVVEEEKAWRLCPPWTPCRVIYRNRRNNIKRKSGNVADFCRRWGAKHECMVSSYADSVMRADDRGHGQDHALSPTSHTPTAPVASGRATLNARPAVRTASTPHVRAACTTGSWRPSTGAQRHIG
jgi:membrane glycosyltransferase